LAAITYQDLLKDRLAYGSPESVARQLKQIQNELQLSGFICEMNVGGLVPKERVLNSVELFAKEVAPALR
jgi:alkanesulfonate monooxygenase SsuD/methylene tetrahydromethanopterin reductase-like flavin-dependent oxidoreductase (luciferase family)